jgi:predicted nucleotidyltransferase
MDIKHLRENNLIILECISGSKAYGLDTPNSDTDVKGVFILPKAAYYGLNYIPQVSDESNDVVFYELRRFIELLSVNNPNILELLNTPEESIIYKHPLLNAINAKDILSKLCKNTFGKFAWSQVKKAKGLNKKILNPMEKDRKDILSFCYCNYGQGAVSLKRYLEIKQWQQEDCGLVNIPHMNNIFGLYHNQAFNYNGIMKSKDSNQVSLSAIPKYEKQETLLFFNKDGYTTYCKEYSEYWSWVEKRNEQRYENTLSHGKQYDAKNMLHTFRLLNMAIEIAEQEKVIVKRRDREFLLKIKSGNFEYQELLEMAKKLQDQMALAYQNSYLPDKPNLEKLNQLAFDLRERFYQSNLG